MELSTILAKLRKEAKLTQKEVAEYISGCGNEITLKAVSKWEQGAVLPDARQFLLLCRLYGVRDILHTFFGEAVSDPFESLNPSGRLFASEIIELVAASPKYHSGSRIGKIRQIPLYELPVSAGTGQFLDGESYEMIEVDDTVPEAATMAVRISGDSMSPRFVDGQTVFVEPATVLREGEIGIFILNGESFCKKLGGGKKPRLISLNPKYQPIDVHPYDTLHVVGKVVG